MGASLYETVEFSVNKMINVQHTLKYLVFFCLYAFGKYLDLLSILNEKTDREED